MFVLTVPSFAQTFYESSTVTELNSKNFDRIVLQSDHVWIVQLYAKWCGHSRKAVEEYLTLGNCLEYDTNICSVTHRDVNSRGLKKRVHAGAIDIDDNDRSFIDSFDVDGVPSFLIYGRNKSAPITYEGTRSAYEILTFVIQMADDNEAISEYDSDVDLDFESGSGVGEEPEEYTTSDAAIGIMDENEFFIPGTDYQTTPSEEEVVYGTKEVGDGKPKDYSGSDVVTEWTLLASTETVTEIVDKDHVHSEENVESGSIEMVTSQLDGFEATTEFGFENIEDFYTNETEWTPYTEIADEYEYIDEYNAPPFVDEHNDTEAATEMVDNEHVHSDEDVESESDEMVTLQLNAFEATTRVGDENIGGFYRNETEWTPWVSAETEVDDEYEYVDKYDASFFVDEFGYGFDDENNETEAKTEMVGKDPVHSEEYVDSKSVEMVPSQLDVFEATTEVGDENIGGFYSTETERTLTSTEATTETVDEYDYAVEYPDLNYEGSEYYDEDIFEDTTEEENTEDVSSSDSVTEWTPTSAEATTEIVDEETEDVFTVTEWNPWTTTESEDDVVYDESAAVYETAFSAACGIQSPKLYSVVVSVVFVFFSSYFV